MLVLLKTEEYAPMKMPYVSGVAWYASGTYWQLTRGEGEIRGLAVLQERNGVTTFGFGVSNNGLASISETANNINEIAHRCHELYIAKQPIDFTFTKIRKTTKLVGLRGNKIVDCVIDPAVEPLVKMRVEMMPTDYERNNSGHICCQTSFLSDGEHHYEIRKGVKAVELSGSNLVKVQEAIGNCVSEYRENL